MHVMLIDDSEDDLMLLADALGRVSQQVKITTVDNGGEALSLLHDASENRATPHLVLLDVNMPRISGFDVLAAIRSDPRTATVPVVMFSTSDHPADVRRAYSDGANSFLRKPLDLADLRDLMTRVFAYWSCPSLLRDEAS